MTKARTLADNFAADINGITAGTGITGGGTSGTVTITNDMATAINAKGDLVVGTGADAYARLAVASTAGYLLTVDSAETTGLKWSAPAGGGKVLQVVSAHKADAFSTSSTSFTDVTDLSVTLTPATTSSKVLILVSVKISNSSRDENTRVTLLRGSTEIANSTSFGFDAFSYYNSATNVSPTMVFIYPANINFLDSPATTSSTTYKIQMKVSGATGYLNRPGYDTTIWGTSTITALEIGA